MQLSSSPPFHKSGRHHNWIPRLRVSPRSVRVTRLLSLGSLFIVWNANSRLHCCRGAEIIRPWITSGVAEDSFGLVWSNPIRWTVLSFHVVALTRMWPLAVTPFRARRLASPSVAFPLNAIYDSERRRVERRFSHVFAFHCSKVSPRDTNSYNI